MEASEADHKGARQKKRGHLARLAHELKTPLTAIVSASEIMRDERLGPMGNDRYRAYAEDIHNSARHLLNVINRVMDQRRAEIAGQVIERRNAEIDVGEVTGALLSSLAPLAERAGLRFERRLQEPLPLLIADVTAVRQILLNLITNALKFTPSGGLIEIGAHLDPDARLVVWVSDNGPGLDPEVLPGGKTCEGAREEACMPELEVTGLRFAGGLAQSKAGGRRDGAGSLPHEAASPEEASMQTDGGAANRTSEAATGLGLGLPTVAKLAGENQATVSVYSTRGAGTCIEVAFPATRLVFV